MRSVPALTPIHWAMPSVRSGNSTATPASPRIANTSMMFTGSRLRRTNPR